MEIYETHETLPRPARPCVVTIGSFDGLHRGHLVLMDRVKEKARNDGLAAAVLTFQPHPARLLAPRFSPPLLMPHDRKLRGLQTLGLDLVLAQRFDAGFAALSAEDFARLVLGQSLAARRVVVGDDFTFGRDRRGEAQDLAGLGKQYGFDVEVVRRLSVEGMAVSSTRIRSFLLQGKARGASVLLGRPYVVEGRVVAGRGRGRGLGYPTANVQAEAELLPARGVYVCHVWVQGRPGGRLAATNVGTSPTFGPGELTVEVHLLDQDEDFVGRRMAVAFLERLRAEQHFVSAEALKAQIERDVRETRRIGQGMEKEPALPGLDGILLDR